MPGQIKIPFHDAADLFIENIYISVRPRRRHVKVPVIFVPHYSTPGGGKSRYRRRFWAMPAPDDYSPHLTAAHMRTRRIDVFIIQTYVQIYKCFFVYENSCSISRQHSVQDIRKRFHGVFDLLHRIRLSSCFQKKGPRLQMQIIP